MNRNNTAAGRKEKTYLSMGEFAAAAEIKRDTLVYYIKIGLVLPAKIAGNGYKYFLPEQTKEIAFIKYMKRCGISLREIRQIINGVTVEEFSEIMENTSRRITENIERLRRASSFLDRVRNHNDLINGHNVDKPFMKELDEDSYYLTPVRFCHSLNDPANAAILSDFLEFGDEFLPEHLMCCVIPDDKLDGENFCMYMQKSFGQRDQPDRNLILRPAGSYAIIVHNGGTGTIRDTAQHLMNYIKISGMKRTGGAFILSSAGFMNLTDSNENKYVIEIPVAES